MGIAGKEVTEFTPKLKKWWKTQCKEADTIAQATREKKAQSTRQTLVSKANSASIKDANVKIMACAAKHKLTINIDAEGNHAITPNTSECPVCKRKHEHDRGFLFIDEHGIKCFCFRAYDEYSGTPGKDNGNTGVQFTTMLEAFPCAIPTLEGLITYGAMYWAQFLL